MEMRFIVALDTAIVDGPSGPGHVVPRWRADLLTGWAWHVQEWNEEDDTVLLHATEAGIAEGVCIEEAAAQWAAWAEAARDAASGEETWRPRHREAGSVPRKGTCLWRPDLAVTAFRELIVSGRPALALALARTMVEAGDLHRHSVEDAGMFPDWP